MTALMWAAFFGHISCAQLQLAHGAYTKLKSDGSKVLEDLEEPKSTHMRHVTSWHVPYPPLIGQYMNSGLWLVKTRHVPPSSRQSVSCRAFPSAHRQPASELWTNQRPVFRSRDQQWPITDQQLPQPRVSFPLDTTLVCCQRVLRFLIFNFYFFLTLCSKWTLNEWNLFKMIDVWRNEDQNAGVWVNTRVLGQCDLC